MCLWLCLYVLSVPVEENVVGKMNGPMCPHSCMSSLLLGVMANVVYQERSRGVILQVRDIYEAYQIVAWLEFTM